MRRRLYLAVPVMTAIVLALLVGPAAAQDGQQSPPSSLSCPAGYNLVEQWSGELAAVDNMTLPSEISEDFSLAQSSNAQLTVWSGVGHPEAGCEVGTQTGTSFPCDQGQQNEEFNIILNGGQVAFVPDHGEDQWKEFGNVNLGTLNSGNHTIIFRHTGENDGSAESVSYLVGLCVQEVPQSQGCTPGYWKQDHHFDSWPGDVTQSTDFDTAFGLAAGTTGDATLLSALNLGGGGQNALMRHAAAALLNSLSGSVNYALSVDQVKTIVQQAFASGDFESAKNQLEAQNDQQRCPLD